MGNPFLERAERTKNLSNSHRRSRKQEKGIAKRIGAIVTPASGAKDVKGDVRLKSVLRIECKTTKNKSFSVTLDMIAKIEEAAISTGEMPVIIIEFHDGYGRPIREVAVCPTYVLDDIRRK